MQVDTLVVALPALPTLTLGGIPNTLPPLEQVGISVSLAAPYPVDLNGVLTLAFQPAGATPVDDPSIQFSTGGRSATFTIPAQTTNAVFAAGSAGGGFGLQTGNVEGTITLAVQSLQASGIPLAAPPTAQLTIQLAPAAPILESVSITATNGGFNLQISAASNTRELTQAMVSFLPAAGSNLTTSQLLIPLTSIAQAWFQGSQSTAFGRQFSLTLPFTIQGDSNAVGSVTVVLSNTAGNSQPASTSY